MKPFQIIGSIAVLLFLAIALSISISRAKNKTEFNVVLKDGGADKIQVIRTVREIDPSLGLVEADEFFNSPPKTIKEGVSEDEAKKIKEKLEAVGAYVEIE